jgi:hypothetical protein
VTRVSTPLPAAWSALVDDAAIFPPGDAPVSDAVHAYVDRREDWWADLVASFVVSDIKVGEVDQPLPLSVVVSGGAGSVPGALGLARRRGHEVAGLEVALRDLDDLPGNARRVVAAVDAARADGVLGDDTPAYVELPHVPSSGSWLAAADVVAEAGLRLKFRTGGVEASQFPVAHALARWIDAALDRETPFKCTAGLHHALAHTVTEGFDRPVDQHGFLNVMVATVRAFDGGPIDEMVALLEERDADVLLAAAAGEDLDRARTWFTSFGSCSVTEPLDDLLALGLMEKP